MTLPRPTRAALEAARDGIVPDLIGPELGVLFCGINPSLYSAAVGAHFARPGNRFWKALHLGGFTARLLDPSEGRRLLAAGCGITNIVERATATAAELDDDELRAGGRRLARKLRRWRPRWLAVLGIGAYRTAFGRRDAALGPQPDAIAGVRVWVLPNPSGLNANYQLPALGAQFAALRAAAGDGIRPEEAR